MAVTQDLASDYRVLYARSVVEFMRREIQTRKAYEHVDSYRKILSAFPEAGAVYEPYYESVTPPVPCRYITVPGTPFTLYYAVDDDERVVRVFHIEHQRANPRERF